MESALPQIVSMRQGSSSAFQGGVVAHAVRLSAPRRVAHALAPERAPGPGEVLVAVHGSAVSVAAELAVFRGDDPAPTLPCTLGYESIGQVLARGPGVEAPTEG